MIIYGINPVSEALRAGRLSEVKIAGRASGRLLDVVRAAEGAGVPVRHVPPSELDRLAHGGVHQGVAGEASEAAMTVSLDALVAGSRPPALLVVLDGIEDPHNVGAILRSVDAAGGNGVVRQSRHAAPLGGAAAKASAGAVSFVPVADVVNIARALEALKAAGIWTVGLAGEAEMRYDQVDFTLPTALVVGGEGSGLRRLVRERCDWLVSIPMHGRVQSLNVSVATGIALFEAARQRRGLGARQRDQKDA